MIAPGTIAKPHTFQAGTDGTKGAIAIIAVDLRDIFVCGLPNDANIEKTVAVVITPGDSTKLHTEQAGIDIGKCPACISCSAIISEDFGNTSHTGFEADNGKIEIAIAIIIAPGPFAAVDFGQPRCDGRECLVSVVAIQQGTVGAQCKACKQDIEVTVIVEICPGNGSAGARQTQSQG